MREWQAQKEKERIREENERIKKKERELKEAEAEKERLEALERPRILAAKREKLIAERNARRQSQVRRMGPDGEGACRRAAVRSSEFSILIPIVCTQAESSEKILSEKAAEIAEKNTLRAGEHARYRDVVQVMLLLCHILLAAVDFGFALRVLVSEQWHAN